MEERSGNPSAAGRPKTADDQTPDSRHEPPHRRVMALLWRLTVCCLASQVLHSKDELVIRPPFSDTRKAKPSWRWASRTPAVERVGGSI